MKKNGTATQSTPEMIRAIASEPRSLNGFVCISTTKNAMINLAMSKSGNDSDFDPDRKPSAFAALAKAAPALLSPLPAMDITVTSFKGVTLSSRI